LYTLMRPELTNVFIENMQERLEGKKLQRKSAVRSLSVQTLLPGYAAANGSPRLNMVGTTDSTLFEFWFENCLLKEVDSGTTIILDNATFGNVK